MDTMSDLAGGLFTYVTSFLWYLRRAWPVTLMYGAPLAEPSGETEHIVLTVIMMLKSKQVTDQDLQILMQANQLLIHSQVVIEDKATCARLMTFKLKFTTAFQDKDDIPKIIRHEEVLRFLHNLSRSENWAKVVDSETGLDLLQTAVVHRHKRIVELLVHTLGFDLDRYRCSPPVHLAAYLGQADLLSSLLRLGAKVTKRRGMCFPEPHAPIRLESGLLGYLGFQHRPVYLCASHRLTPVQCAIQRDQLDCVKTLLHHDEIHSLSPAKQPLGVSPLSLLMFACREGSPNCIRHLVAKFPDYINSYMDGETPLMAAVPWGEQCVHILLESGADVHLRSDGILETALHRLYRQNIDGLFTIYDTTKYLLTTGLEQEVNAYTHLGETPLHMLISHISYTGGNYVDPERKVPRADLQDSYQKQVVAAVRLLLEFNADPHLLNSPGLTSLSRLLHIALKAVHIDDDCPCVSSAQPDMFVRDYRHDYAVIADVLEILLEFGSDPNFKCPSSHTPLILLLQLLLYDDLANICSQRSGILRCFSVLMRHGAETNFTDATGKGSAYSLVSAVCRRCLVSQNSDDVTENDGSEEGDDDIAYQQRQQKLRDEFAKVLNDVLSVMLEYGLDPNIITNKVAQHLWGGHGNGFIEFVRLAGLASTSQEFEYIGQWLQTMLKWGSDPDVEPYPSEPIICHCQSSIFLKKLGTQPICHFVHEIKDKEHLLHESAVQRILYLFYCSMSHSELHASISAARSSLHLQPTPPLTGSIPTSLSLLCDGRMDVPALLNAMGDNPRSLKEMARVAVYVALKRQLALGVDQLPLPFVVKKYLSEPVF